MWNVQVRSLPGFLEYTHPLKAFPIQFQSDLKPETRRSFCIFRKYALKRLQEKSWASASGVEQKVMLEIRLILLTKASSFLRYQPTYSAPWWCACPARRQDDPWENLLCLVLSPFFTGYADSLLVFSIRWSTWTCFISCFLLYNSCNILSFPLFALFCFCYASFGPFSITQTYAFSFFPSVPVATPLAYLPSQRCICLCHWTQYEFLAVPAVPCTVFPFLCMHTDLSCHFSPGRSTHFPTQCCV